MRARHVTSINGPSAAGLWGWSCYACGSEAHGYGLAADVLAAAREHGPLAATSCIPTDEEED